MKVCALVIAGVFAGLAVGVGALFLEMAIDAWRAGASRWLVFVASLTGLAGLIAVAYLMAIVGLPR